MLQLSRRIIWKFLFQMMDQICWMIVVTGKCCLRCCSNGYKGGVICYLMVLAIWLESFSQALIQQLNRKELFSGKSKEMLSKKLRRFLCGGKISFVNTDKSNRRLVWRFLLQMMDQTCWMIVVTGKCCSSCCSNGYKGGVICGLFSAYVEAFVCGMLWIVF